MAASFTVDRASFSQKFLFAIVGIAVFAVGGLADASAFSQWPSIPAFLPAVTMTVIVADLITSFLLIAQFRLTGAPTFAVLGAAFLFTGLIALAQLLASPGILRHEGLFGGGEATAARLWLYWHGGFAVFILAFSTAELLARHGALVDLRRSWLSLELTILAPIVLVMLAILMAGLQGATGAEVTRHHALGVSIFSNLTGALNLMALIAVIYATRGRTVADLALTIAALASLFDVFLSVGATPYSAGWYVGRLFSVLSSCSILVVFLEEVTQLYARTISINISLEKIANLDGLTGLPNRRQFDERLATEWAGAVRRQSSIGFIMIDVDFFKRYNDQYGHLEGDEALRRVADAIRDTAKRTTDLPARYGGEEFTVILPDTDLAAATQLAESIRAAVKRIAIPHGGNPPLGIITISLGVAAMVPPARSSQEMLTKAADEALYWAKDRGRDRVEVSDLDTGQSGIGIMLR